MPLLAIAMADTGPPKETRERICPQCRSADLLALGRVLADNTGIRSAYRCRGCATEFLLFFPDRRVGPRDRRATD
jgi:transposase-like protein